MQSLPLISGLSALAADYDGIVSDVWGVLYDGAAAYPDAVDALHRARAAGLKVVLVTNAPSRAGAVMAELGRFGIDAGVADAVITSGDVCRGLIAAETRRKAVHIGTDYTLQVLDGLDVALVGDLEAEYVICTALENDEVEHPEDYRGRFQRLVDRGLPLYCFNPDIVVERGAKLVYCAGALAELYAELGGEVIVGGKPHKPIYDAALAALAKAADRPIERSRVLAIGDGLPTDILGASRQRFDVLMVTGGIHAADFGATDAPDMHLVAARLADEGLAARAGLPRLVW